VHQVGDHPRLYYDARSTNHHNTLCYKKNCTFNSRI